MELINGLSKRVFPLILMVIGTCMGTCTGTGAAKAGEWKKEHHGRTDYWLYLPTTARSTRALMMSLHGCAQKADDLKEYGNWEAAAEAHGVVVALPQVPNGGVVFGCWDYYGGDHTETNHHNQDLLELLQALIAKPELRIDPRAVYVSGLSAGGSEALVLGCLRPDLIAGIGLASGPAIGTELEDLQSPRSTAKDAHDACLRLAGERRSAFATQIAALIRGDQDLVVNPEHSRINQDALRTLYGATQETPLDVQTLPGVRTAGSALVFANGSNGADGARGHRIASIINNNLSHNWPAGQGGSTIQFIARDAVNFPAFLARFFEENNRRR